jgi:NADH-quinone oxidoreductase subunit J
MNAAFIILATVSLLGAAAAMSLRKLVHCAFSLVAAFGALAGIYLRLDAEFVGLAQILVYVGSVAILIVFAILLTRGGDDLPAEKPVAGWWTGLVVAGLVFATLTAMVLSSRVSRPNAVAEVQVSVKAIGLKLMTDYVAALEVIGLLLTAALIGAVIIAMQDNPAPNPGKDLDAPPSEGAGGRTDGVDTP